MTPDEAETAAAWVRLGRAVRSARGRIGPSGWTQQQLADALGVTVKTINTLEAGRARGMRANTKAALEDVLGWLPGEVDRVLDGAEPRVDPNRRPGGQEVVTEENPRPEGEVDRGSVRPAGEADYVTEGGAPGDDEPELLAEIADTARRLAELVERMSKRDRRP